MDTRLPKIFLKVGETVFSVESPPSFTIYEDRLHGYGNPKEPTVDIANRSIYVQFICDTLKAMLEREL